MKLQEWGKKILIISLFAAMMLVMMLEKLGAENADEASSAD